MKIVYRYILTNFFKKFLPSFIIIYFIFIIQTFWLYYDELAGKGLGLWTIFKFLIYYSPFVILNVIPLSILLGGIMSFGSMSEKSEFTAMKSMGISLKDMMKALSPMIILLSIGAFIFANTALPYGNYKFSNLRRNIKKKMPSVAITEGVFNDFKPAGINIHVKKKYGKNNNRLKDIIIHQKVNGIPDKVIIAKKGLFKSDPDNQLIQLILYDGNFYEDQTRQQKNAGDRKKHPAMKTAFKEHIINIDVSSINKVDLDKTSISAAHHMLNVIDLKKEIDTFKKKNIQKKENFTEELLRRINVKNIKKKQTVNFKKYNSIYRILKDTTLYDTKALSYLYNRAVQKAEALEKFSLRKAEYFKKRNRIANKYKHSFSEKFTYPVMVIIMFLVGIPLGAIIKKGGFGISVVLGIIIFVTYYILSMLGKNASEEGAVFPYLGAWFATAVLLPLGIYLTYKAHNDSEFAQISNLIEKIKQFLKKTNS